jgi:hypothetical protein
MISVQRSTKSCNCFQSNCFQSNCSGLSHAWSAHNLCYKIFIAIGFICAILLIVPILLGIGVVMQHIISIDSDPNLSRCSSIGMCILFGLYWITLGVIVVFVINLIFLPIYRYIWTNGHKYRSCICIIMIALGPVYFFGPTLAGVAIHKMTGSMIECTLTSWWSFMNSICLLQGLIYFGIIGMIELCCIGFYCLIRCALTKCITFDKSNNFFDPADPADPDKDETYGSMRAEYNSIRIDLENRS